jgi:small ligand-binding sensory domain FIST
VSAHDPLLSLNEKMETLLKIQAALAVKGMETQQEKIAFLYSVGLGPSFIANLLGVKPKTVSGTMAKHKKTASAKEEAGDE